MYEQDHRKQIAETGRDFSHRRSIEIEERIEGGEGEHHVEWTSFHLAKYHPEDYDNR
jgi:hypothetical protein